MIRKKNDSTAKNNESFHQELTIRSREGDFLTDENSNDDNPENFPPKIIEQSKFKQLREKMGYIVNSTSVQILVFSMILINSIMMGISTFDFVSKNEKLNDGFEIVDGVLLIFFTIEAVMQIFYEGRKTFKNPWLMFDILIVLSSWLLNELQVVRAVRVFRALRLVTRLKGMRDLVEALARTLPRMLGITALLSLIIYVFSVMFTEFFREDWTSGKSSEPYFARLDGSLLTSFQMMTFDGWAEIVREIMSIKSWAWIPFVSFIIITGFMVIHLVIAVICDALATLDEKDKKAMNAKYLMRDMFGDDAIDADAESDCCSESDQKSGINTDIVTLCGQVDTLEKQMHELVISNERTIQWLNQLTLDLKEN